LGDTVPPDPLELDLRGGATSKRKEGREGKGKRGEGKEGKANGGSG